MWDTVTPVEEMMRALDDAVRADKVMYMGISDQTPTTAVAQSPGFFHSLLNSSPSREMYKSLDYHLLQH